MIVQRPVIRGWLNMFGKPQHQLNQLLKWMEIDASQHAVSVHGICVDSRLLKPNQLFFALKGACSDGHAFVREAAANGAVAAVVNVDYTVEIPGFQLIRVKDPLSALQLLAKNALAARSTKVVAVTGSVGKTTTKEFICSMLKRQYSTACSPGNSNSQIGLALSVLNNTRGDEDYLVLEMGMTEAGHIQKLVEIAPPDIAVITNTALVHACNFDDLAAIGRAKGEIFSHRKTKLGILDRAIANFEEVAGLGTCSKRSFSVERGDGDCTAALEEGGLRVRVGAESTFLPAPFVPGRHNIHNFLAAAIVARECGMSWEYIKDAIPFLKLPEKRMEIFEKNGIVFVNDSYNASAISVKAALCSLPTPRNGGRKIAVLGAMLELGKFSEECHREVGEFALRHVEQMFCVGKECLPVEKCWLKEGMPVKWREEISGMIDVLRKELRAGDVVLVKGSRASGIEGVLHDLLNNGLFETA